MRAKEDIERVIYHFYESAYGAKKTGDTAKHEASVAIIRVLKWVLGEDGDFSELLKALDAVGDPELGRNIATRIKARAN